MDHKDRKQQIATSKLLKFFNPDNPNYTNIKPKTLEVAMSLTKEDFKDLLPDLQSMVFYGHNRNHRIGTIASCVGAYFDFGGKWLYRMGMLDYRARKNIVCVRHSEAVSIFCVLLKYKINKRELGKIETLEDILIKLSLFCPTPLIVGGVWPIYQKHTPAF